MKNVLITGTSRGIGFALVQQFAKQGHRVLALSRNATTVEAIGLEGVTALAVDLSLEKDLIKVTDYIDKNWGSVDILIHNAGTLVNRPFETLRTEDFLEVYKVNVFAVAELTRRVLPFLISGSHVVSISSMGGIQGSVKFPGLAAYSSSKGALITLSELLAEEYKQRNIAFNVLALGAVQTEMLEAAFPGYQAPVSATEMADYIYQFACTGNQFYNGKVLQVSASTP